MPKQWFPLESNPAVMNEYIAKLGVNLNDAQFFDVLSTEDWAFDMVPTPVIALLLLFPISSMSEEHRRQEREAIDASGQFVSPDVFYMKQTVGNACGTVGILHALINAQRQGLIPPAPEGTYLETFMATTNDMTPLERAVYLENDDEIEIVHEEAATQGQSEQPEGGRVDAHFITFIVVDGTLYELDGRKGSPINHGPASTDTFLWNACAVVKQFMDRDPGEMRFGMVALAAPTVAASC